MSTTPGASREGEGYSMKRSKFTEELIVFVL